MSVTLVDVQRPGLQVGNVTTETTIYTVSLAALANGAHFNCLWLIKSRNNIGAGIQRTVRVKFGASAFVWTVALAATVKAQYYVLYGRIHRTNGLAGPANHAAFFSGRTWELAIASYDAGDTAYNNPGNVQANDAAAVNEAADPITLALTYQWPVTAPNITPSAECIYGRILKSTP